MRESADEQIFFTQIAADDGELYGLSLGNVYVFIRPRTARSGYDAKDRTKGGWVPLSTSLYKEGE